MSREIENLIYHLRGECSRWLFLSDPKINTSVSIEIKTYFEAQFPCLSKFLRDKNMKY